MSSIVALAAFRHGIGAHPGPSELERRIVRQLRHWAIPASARATPNPVPGGPEAIAEARAHFANHCASCHGSDGSGATKIGRSLYPRAPDMRLPATQALSDGELFWIIENGVRFTGMPAWATPGSAEDSWKLVLFIRHLPQLTTQEKAAIEAMTPRTPEELREREEEERFLRGEDVGSTPSSDDRKHR